MDIDVQKTLALVKQAMQNPSEEIAKAFTQSATATSGLTYYDLEAPAKTLYPVLTPIRNETPRVSGRGGIQANWRAVTAINTGALEIGVSEGKRSGTISTTVADYLAAYKGIGLEDYVTFEATYAGEGFEDVKARAVRGLLESLMIGEEAMLLYGNGTAVALGTTPTPSLTHSGSGSALTNVAYTVVCVALTAQGYAVASVSGGVRAKVTRTSAGPVSNTDTYGGGAAKLSSSATVTPSAGENINATVAQVPGASAYAWYWGTGGVATLGAITTINSVVITDAAAGTQVSTDLDANDWSKNALGFDGLLYQAYKSGSNAYIYHMATGTAGTGTPLTAGTDGSITEFDDALKSLWDNYRLSPDIIRVSSQEARYLRSKILTGTTSGAQRFVFTTDQRGVTGGVMVKSYLNPFGMGAAKEIPIEIHPNLPPGTVLMQTRQLPYKLSNVVNVFQVRTRQEYYQLEWPQTQRQYEYGVYADEVAQHYFPPSMAVIDNIAAG